MMDTDELQRAAEHFMAEPYLTGFLEFLGYFNELRDERNKIKSKLDEVSKRYTTMVIQNSALAADNERLTEELIRACAELSGINKQEPAAYCIFSETGNIRIWWSNDGGTREYSAKAWAEANGYPLTSLYAKPVHQHSFTLSGIGTFYADSELEITYLERLHGVGGKANLKAVDEEHF